MHCLYIVAVYWIMSELQEQALNKCCIVQDFEILLVENKNITVIANTCHTV